MGALLVQGLAPLANDGRPSGAKKGKPSIYYFCHTATAALRNA